MRSAAGVKWLVLLAIVCLIPLSLGRHVLMQGDQGRLIEIARSANDAGVLAPVGLLGTKAFCYGPVVANLYQLVLLFTHDPARLAGVVGSLFFLLTLGSAAWLVKELRLCGMYVLLLACSPFLWIAGRSLWDNPWTMPLGLLALAGYARFVRVGSGLGLFVAIVGSGLAVLTHLMALPTAAAIAIHAALFRPKMLIRAWPTVLAAIVLLGSYSYRYIAHEFFSGDVAAARFSRYIADRQYGYLTHWPTKWDALLEPDIVRPPLVVLFAFSAATTLAAPTHDTPGFDRPLVVAARWIGSAAIVPMVVGAMLCLLRTRRPNHIETTDADRARQSIGLACVLAIALMVVLALRINLVWYSHYHHGILAPTLVLIVIGLAWLESVAGRRVAAGVVAMLCLAGAIQSAQRISSIAEFGGLRTRNLAAPSIGSLIESINADASRGGSPMVWTDIREFGEAPHAWVAARNLLAGDDAVEPAGTFSDQPAEISQVCWAEPSPAARVTIRTGTMPLEPPGREVFVVDLARIDQYRAGVPVRDDPPDPGQGLSSGQGPNPGATQKFVDE